LVVAELDSLNDSSPEVLVAALLAIDDEAVEGEEMDLPLR